MYIIVELQTSGDTTAALHDVKATKPLAEQEFHRRASYAAVSNVDIHTIVMLNPEGHIVGTPACFKHNNE